MSRALPKRWAAQLWVLGVLILGPPCCTLPARAQTPMGPPISLSDYPVCLPSDPAVAPHPDGGFVATWEFVQVYLRRFDRHGAAMTPEVSLEGLAFGGIGSRLAVAPSGVVARAAWVESGWQIWFFRPDLTPLGPPVPLEETPVAAANGPLLAADGEDGFVVVWLRPDALAVARFDLEGRATGPVLEARPEPPAILGGLRTLGVQPSGDLWLLSPVGPAACDIPCGSLTLLRLAAGGTELQTVIRGVVSFVRSADLAVLPDGEVALALGSYGDVTVLRFDAAGRVSGPDVGELEPVAVAEDPLGRLRVLDLSSDAAGNLLLVWEDFGMAGARLRARSLTPEALPAGPELSLTERSVLSDFSARAAPLETGEAVVVWSDVLQALIDPLPCATFPGPFARRLSMGGPQALVLGDGRFRVEVKWLAPLQGTHGRGRAVPDTRDSGGFWFFDPNNLELTVKMLDGRPVNGYFWFFYGALSNVGYRITVTDQLTGRTRTYDNPPGRFGSFADTMAFLGGSSP